jgi:large repetitive protein
VSNPSGNSNTFTLTLDGNQIFTTTVAAMSATFNWDTGPAGNGPHTLGLTVKDASGAIATATRSVTVNNNTTGDILVTFPALTPGQIVRGLQTVRVQAENTAGASNRFEVSVDSVIRDLVITSATTIDWSWNTMGLVNGSHTISVTVNDATGRTGTGSAYVNVQNGLSVALTSPNSGATVSGIAWVDIWASGYSGTSNVYTLTVAGVVVASTTDPTNHVTLPWDTTKTPNGAQTMVAQVRDAAGNGGQFTRPVTVSNAAAPPAASFTSPAAGASVSGTVAVGMKATGGAAPFKYKLTIDGTQVFSTTVSATTASYSWVTTTYDNGGHALVLTVTDSRGGSTSATRIVNTQNGPGPLTASFTTPAAGTTVSGTVTVGLAATGGTPPYTYTLTIDGGAPFTTNTSATSVSYSWDTRTVADGSHTLTLTVSDSKSGSSTATRSVTVQNGPLPLNASFTSPAPGATVAGMVTVGMAASGGTPPYTYALTIDGGQPITTSTSATSASYSWNTTTGTGNGPHTLTLTLTDSASGSSTATRSVSVQNLPLSASFTSPASGATVSGTVTVGLAAAGGAPPYTYTATVDGNQVFTTSTSATSASLAWSTATVANGNHTLGLTVTDSASGSATATRPVTVTQNGTLQVFVTQPSPGAVVSGTNWVVLWLGGSSGASNTYTLSVAGQIVMTTTTSSTGPVSIPWDTTQVASGPQTLLASARDATGNTGSSSVPITVQNGPTPLSASINSPAAGATVSGTVTVTMAASGGAPPYTYRLTVDGAQVFSTSTSATSTTFGWNTTTASNAAHTLTLTVTDSASTTRTATLTVTVQNLQLSASFTSPAAGATVSGTVTVGMAASGGSAPYTYSLTVDGAPLTTTNTSATSASYSWNTTSIANGSHTLALTVTDSTGATATASSRQVNVANTGTFQVFVTSPSPGQTVSGVTWVTIWTQGAAAGTKSYTMTVGASTVWTDSSSDNPVGLPWITTNTPNGQQTLVVTVRDSTGATGTTSVTVMVQN